MKFQVPKSSLEVVEFDVDLSEACLSDHVLNSLGISRRAYQHMQLSNAAKSSYLNNKLLDHYMGKAEYAMPTAYLALCTVVPEASKTGSTITEANYTGYARKKIEGEALSSAASSEWKSGAAITYAECTSGSSTIIGWATCDALTVGNMLIFGTCASTVISTTQTPASVPKELLVVKES